MTENDVKLWKEIKGRAKTSLILLITNFITFFFSFIFLLIPYVGFVIYGILWIPITVIGIFWLVNLIKEFMAFEKLSQKQKDDNSRIFTLLILNIFFGFIFSIIIYVILPKDYQSSNVASTATTTTSTTAATSTVPVITS